MIFAPRALHAPALITNLNFDMSTIIAPQAVAPDFELDSHLDSKVKLSDLLKTKHALLVFYPLDFTPT